MNTTTGGEGGPTVTVTTLSQLNSNAAGTSARIIQLMGKVSGDVTIGSNKTLIGLCGATIQGHVELQGSTNVIVRNLAIVGNNCKDNPDCQSGADAVSVEKNTHHVWFDHDDISDGSDGNLDITHAADFITISWTKFHYSGQRAGGHQFSNLIGNSDSNGAEDTGHLRVTFHHDWWADHVVERMPRVRFGHVHVFNSLYTATGDDYCIELGNGGNIRDERNVFIKVKNPIDVSHGDATSIITSVGNVYTTVTGTTANMGAAAFVPPYPYSLDAATAVESAIMNNVGPQ